MYTEMKNKSDPADSAGLLDDTQHNLREQKSRISMRIILYLGKGGVGKTTIAAATAVRSAMLGKRTLVVSTDLAHSLADCFTTALTSEPKELAPNLWAQEVNVLDEMRHSWGKVQEVMSKALRKRGWNAVMAEEL